MSLEQFDNSSYYKVLILTKSDGSETCPILWRYTDLLVERMLNASEVNIEGNDYIKRLIDMEKDIVDYRVEDLTSTEIVERGYRENPFV